MHARIYLPLGIIKQDQLPVKGSLYAKYPFGHVGLKITSLGTSVGPFGETAPLVPKSLKSTINGPKFIIQVFPFVIEITTCLIYLRYL
jgi:hypothetical protein